MTQSNIWSYATNSLCLQ